MGRIIVKNCRMENTFWLILCLPFVTAGIGLIVTGDRVGWLVTLLFGLCVLGFIRRITDASPRLIIDEQGVIDCMLGAGRIPWADIKGAYVASVKGCDFLCFELNDPKKYRQRLSRLKRMLASVSRLMGFTDFTLNLSGVDASAAEILKLVKKYSGG